MNERTYEHSIYVTNKSRLIFQRWTLYRSKINEKPSAKKTENNYLWSMSLFFIVGTRSEWINIKGIYVEMKIEPEKLATNWDRWLQCKRVEEIRIIFYQLVWQCVTLTLKLCVKCETASYLLNMCDSVIAANEQKKKVFAFTSCWFIFHRYKLSSPQLWRHRR